MRLENWSTYDSVFGLSLSGNVYGHPRFKDGTHVITSKIVGKSKGAIVTNSGSRYELGVIDKQFESRHQDMPMILLNSLEEVDYFSFPGEQ